MEVSLTGGAAMTVIGIVAVFAALTALLAAIRLASRILGPTERHPSASPAGDLARGGPASGPESGEELESVALAAYALHLARRVRTPAPAPTSRWVIAGRLRQTAPFERQEPGERWLPTR
jgi:Na+-transporting methylmalonyl-CoA/oxaloacetate decarboxylase gamma subunit